MTTTEAPPRIRAVCVDSQGQTVKDIVIDTAPLAAAGPDAPRETLQFYAHQLLHSTGICRVMLHDAATGGVLLDQSDPPEDTGGQP